MTRHERRDVPAGRVAWGFAGLAALVLLAFAVAGGLLALFPGPPADRRWQVPPPPRLQVDESAGRAAIERAADAKLEGYGWTDRAAGRAHIPIARAMALLAARGWPDDAGTRAP
jgi:hypothetical protein